jgi:hypothetical protein
MKGYRGGASAAERKRSCKLPVPCVNGRNPHRTGWPERPRSSPALAPARGKAPITPSQPWSNCRLGEQGEEGDVVFWASHA